MHVQSDLQAHQLAVCDGWTPCMKLSALGREADAYNNGSPHNLIDNYYYFNYLLWRFCWPRELSAVTGTEPIN